MQNAMIYKEWCAKKKAGEKSLAVLVDPDKADETHLKKLCSAAKQNLIDYFFVGGSLLSTNHLDTIISYLKIHSDIPVILFPGNTLQVNLKADGILLLSLISGRNADLLIGKHVEVAHLLHKSSLEIISTGYMLIDSGRATSVSYISNTLPIPRNKPEIALSTALAGNMLGLKCNYLEAGSGAKKAVPVAMIKLLSKKIDAPLIVGGGIRDLAAAKKALNAGADIIVVGSKIESEASFIAELSNVIHQKTKSV